MLRRGNYRQPRRLPSLWHGRSSMPEQAYVERDISLDPMKESALSPSPQLIPGDKWTIALAVGEEEKNEKEGNGKWRRSEKLLPSSDSHLHHFPAPGSQKKGGGGRLDFSSFPPAGESVFVGVGLEGG